MSVINFFCKKILSVKYKKTLKTQEKEARSLFQNELPEILESFENFGKNGQISSDRQPIKGYDLWKILERRKPKFIVELGSGTTSAVFATWAQRNQATYISYESHEGWHKVTTDSLKNISLFQDSDIRYVPSIPNESMTATRYTQPIPSGADFVYIDGPPCDLPNGKKVPNDDILQFLNSGERPRTIVVDGRIETVDLIRAFKSFQLYDFFPSFNYSILKDFDLKKMSTTDHSVFELK